MDESTRMDIRRLLKRFGVQADEAIGEYLARNPGKRPLRLRVVLEDLTDYGEAPPEERLHLEIEDEIH